MRIVAKRGRRTINLVAVLDFKYPSRKRYFWDGLRAWVVGCSIEGGIYSSKKKAIEAAEADGWQVSERL